MGKKVASSLSIHHVKIMKCVKRKKLLLRRIIDYLKSDTYMFAPLISSQNTDFCSIATPSASCFGVDSSEPILEKKGKLLEKVKDYMMSDQYLYAPLVAHQPLFHSAIGSFSPRDKAVGRTLGLRRTGTNKSSEPMEKLTEETRSPGQRRKSMRIEELRLGRYPYGRTTIITQLREETVKHMVQQNCHS